MWFRVRYSEIYFANLKIPAEGRVHNQTLLSRNNIFVGEKKTTKYTQLVFYPFFHEPFYNSTGKISVIWMQTEWEQLGLTNACKMMHDGIYEIETQIHTQKYIPECVASNPLELCEYHLDFPFPFWILFLVFATSKRLLQKIQIISRNWY